MKGLISIKTYQDLLVVPDNEELRMKFVRDVINEHKATKLYETAFIADKYFRHKNVTINQYQKLLYSFLLLNKSLGSF